MFFLFCSLTFPPKVTLMSVSASNTYMRLQNFRKLDKNAKLSKERALPISGQNLFPQWCQLIRDYTVICFLVQFLLALYNIDQVDNRKSRAFCPISLICSLSYRCFVKTTSTKSLLITFT